MKVLLFLLVIYACRIRTTLAKLEELKSNFTNVVQRFVRSTDDNDDTKNKFLLEILVFLLIFLLLVSIVLAVFLCHQHRERENEESRLEDVTTKVKNKKIEYSDLKAEFEIDETKLEEIENGFLGEGYFGAVLKYNLTHVNGIEKMIVAVKKAKNNRDKQEILIDEIVIMAHISKHGREMRTRPIYTEGAENILSLVGAITTKVNQTWMVSALARCDLKKYLEEIKTRLIDNKKLFTDLIERNEDGIKTGRYSITGVEFSKDIDKLSTFDFLFFAFQITRGMEYLAAVPCVHRDLALRNIFITDDKIVKIGDLGLAREHDKYEACYNQNKCNTLPLLVAPEIKHGEKKNKFSEESDVWSCTLALYEMFKLTGTDSSVANRLHRGEFPSEPEHCLRETFEFMKFGWAEPPRRRPTFAQYRLHFEIELKKFPSQNFDIITEMLKLEKEEQEKLESWVRKDPDEEPLQEGIELTPLNPDQSRNNV